MLSAMMRGYAPAWALGDAGGVARFPVLAGIKHHLTIIVDNDSAGRAAASKCSQPWTAAGCEVRRVVPLLRRHAATALNLLWSGSLVNLLLINLPPDSVP